MYDKEDGKVDTYSTPAPKNKDSIAQFAVLRHWTVRDSETSDNEQEILAVARKLAVQGQDPVYVYQLVAVVEETDFEARTKVTTAEDLLLIGETK